MIPYRSVIDTILDLSKTARTYDDSGWGQKSLTEFNIKLYSDITCTLNITSLTILSDSLGNFINESKINIEGNYFSVDSNKDKTNQEFFEYIFQAKNIMKEDMSNKVKTTQEIEGISFKFRVKRSITSQGINELEIQFENTAYEALFNGFYINSKWFYSEEDKLM